MQISDALFMALNAIRDNKLRSSLTLVGVILGVASIVAVMTAVAEIQGSIEAEISAFGAQTFRLQKLPRGFASDEQQEAAKNWPAVTQAEAQAIRESVKLIDSVGVELWEDGRSASYNGQSTAASVFICGGTPEYSEVNAHEIEFGRNLSRVDLTTRRKVVVLGHALANELFPYIDPIGKKVLMDGQKYEVIGIFTKKVSAFNSRFEAMALIPISAFTSVYGNLDSQGLPRSVNVTLHAKSPELLPDAIEEARQTLRRLRRLKPQDDDNFYYFTNQSAIENFNKITVGLKLGAFVIGTVSLIVAGVGIMNIMLVSVTERTKEIGTRMALGAKRRDVLWQFLLEAAVLCNLGGVIGIALGFGLGNVLALITALKATVPVAWAFYGMVFCSLVGLTFGMVPARKASRLNPIEALRYE